MVKKLIVSLTVLVCAASVPAQTQTEIPWRKNITMLVVPREPQAVQVALDLSRYYPVMTVCYQTTRAAPILYAWNGEEWVAISVEDYVSGSFFSTRPQRVVLVEKENVPAPDVLIPDGTWCKTGHRLTSASRRVMTHLLGLQFNMPYRYWLQLSERYGIPFEQLNPSLDNLPLLHRRGSEKNLSLYEQDMAHWEPLDILPPEAAEPVELIAPEPIEPIELPAETPLEDIQPTDEEAEDVPAEIESLMEEPENDTPETAEQVTVEPETDVLTGESDIPPEFQDDTSGVDNVLSELNEYLSNPDEATPFSSNDIPEAELIVVPE